MCGKRHKACLYSVCVCVYSTQSNLKDHTNYKHTGWVSSHVFSVWTNINKFVHSFYIWKSWDSSKDEWKQPQSVWTARANHRLITHTWHKVNIHTVMLFEFSVFGGGGGGSQIYIVSTLMFYETPWTVVFFFSLKHRSLTCADWWRSSRPSRHQSSSSDMRWWVI